ncbi:gliding motility-associated C-terminal domain-containing protein [Flavobacteriales bacterium]|nr:gliding motility-associated C-terminal domain-containing protein [Flavobacteriales bacterium]
MKRICILIFCLIFVFTANAQISSSSVQGINCYNDTAFIALDANSQLTQWHYKDAGVWVTAANYSFININTTGDTLKTTQCGKYRSIVFWNNGASEEVDSFSLSCPLTIGQGQDPILCYGDSSGTLKRPVFGGTKFDPNNSIILNDTLDGDEYYVYAWYYADDGVGTNSIPLSDTTENLSGISAGWYKAVVTDAIGCTDSIDYLEYKNPQKIAVALEVVDSVMCIGDTTGRIFLKIGGGHKYSVSHKYFYYLKLGNDTIAFSDLSGSTSNFSLFSPDSNMQSFSLESVAFDNLSAGNYVLSVVDSNYCIMLDTIEVLEPEAYTVFSSTTYPLICASDSVEFLIDSIVGGNTILDYYFLGYGSDTINVPAGSYDIYIKDLQFGCEDTLSATCISQYEIEFESTIEHILCYGDASGTITIDSIFGGISPYTVQWGGVNNQALSAGNYIAFFSDSLGCTLMQDFTVEQGEPFSANPIFYPPTCNGLSDGSIKVNVTGGIGPLTYYWLNGSGNIDSLYGLPAGIYSLVVSDSLSCVDTLLLTLNEPEQIAFTYANYENPLLCKGAITTIDINISGGTGPFLVLWSDGNTNAQRVLSAGIYTCEVSDTNGCTTLNTQIIITEPDPFSIQNVFYNDATCDAGGDANITTFGGVNPIQYMWSTGETSQSISSLLGDNYWVIATDSCGNSDTAYFNLSPFELVTALIYDNVMHIGSIEVDYTSTGGPFSYEWVDVVGNIVSTDYITSNLCEGTYFVTTTDITSNCSVTDTLVATYYLPNGIIDVSTTTVFPDVDLWGNPPYSYVWGTGDVTQHADICPGDPTWVEVTDNLGCVIRANFDIDALLITLDPADLIVECNLENLDVDITADASGGTSPYTYSWSNGSTESSINLNLSPGNYSVIVMDNNGCTEDTSFTIATMSAECIPNIFTPNGDNINDTWSLEDTFLYNDSKVRVYGRYGKLLFQSVGYSSPWDGKNEKGNDVPNGVYFYSIEIGHEFDAIKGSVTILR